MRTFDEELQSTMFDLNALAAKHDARTLAVACISKAAYLYQQLRMLGIETPESLTKIFAYGLNNALQDGEKARVIGEVGGVGVSQTGKPN